MWREDDGDSLRRVAPGKCESILTTGASAPAMRRGGPGDLRSGRRAVSAGSSIPRLLVRRRKSLRDADDGNHGYGAAFAADGRLATTSYDGRLRLYDRDGRLLRDVETGVAYPFGVAFSPDGASLAVGVCDAPAVLLYDAGTLAARPAPDLARVDKGNLVPGRLLGGRDDALRGWSAPSGRRVSRDRVG